MMSPFWPSKQGALVTVSVLGHEDGAVSCLDCGSQEVAGSRKPLHHHIDRTNYRREKGEPTSLKCTSTITNSFFFQRFKKYVASVFTLVIYLWSFAPPACYWL